MSFETIPQSGIEIKSHHWSQEVRVPMIFFCKYPAKSDFIFKNATFQQRNTEPDQNHYWRAIKSDGFFRLLTSRRVTSRRVTLVFVVVVVVVFFLHCFNVYSNKKFEILKWYTFLPRLSPPLQSTHQFIVSGKHSVK